MAEAQRKYTRSNFLKPPERKRAAPYGFRAHSVGHPCDFFMVAEILRHRELLSISPDLAWIFEAGHTIEEKFLPMLRRQCEDDGVEYRINLPVERWHSLHLSGGIEFACRTDDRGHPSKDGEMALVDIKSVRGGMPQRLAEALTNGSEVNWPWLLWPAQAQMYMWLYEVPRHSWFFVDKDNFEQWWVPSVLDLDMASTIVERLERLAPSLNGAPMPEPLERYNGRICPGCAARMICPLAIQYEPVAIAGDDKAFAGLCREYLRLADELAMALSPEVKELTVAKESLWKKIQECGKNKMGDAPELVLENMLLSRKTVSMKAREASSYERWSLKVVSDEEEEEP